MTIDLQEATRRDDTFNQMLEINRLLGEVAVFPSLMWTWAFDVIKDLYDNHKSLGEEYTIVEGVTLKQVWDKFWEDAEKLGLNMDLGGETIQEVVMDWMIDNDFLVSLDDDGWLDDEEENEEEVIPQVTGIDSLNRQKPKGWEL
jgi:hypothetical protein